MSIRLFLSYARSDDEPFIARLYAALKVAGFDVWFDRVSMPSRQLTFHQEIRDAVAACDRLILVVGPNAVASDYVTQEWRFAYFEAIKCVNPIIRLNSVDAAGKKIDGYNLIPEDLRLIHAEDFRNDTQFDSHFANLIRQLSDPLPPAGKLVAVPELPPHYLDQPARLAALRDILLADLQKPVVVSGAAARVGLQGMGGIGKSVLASALAHRPEVRRAFLDGVYWVTLGQEPNIADLQRGLARALGDGGLFTDVDAGKEKLRELLGGRAALLVLDDVWQRGAAEAFNVMGPRGRLLLTTRDAGLVTALASKENHYQVQLPTEAEGEALLAKAVGVPIPELPAEARDIVHECGRLPLGLALCGGMVHSGRTWHDLLEALREHDLEYLSDSHPAEEQHSSIWRAMDVSLRALPEQERDRFAELAVFGLDTGAPEDAIETLWAHTAGLSPRRARDLLMNFRQRSLIDFDQSTRRSTLHDLLHNFATGMAEKRFGSLAELHHRLLDAYRKACPNGWPSGPNDGYFLQNLVGHLLAVGEIEDTVALLTDLPWIEAKCKAGLVFSLPEEFLTAINILPEAQAELTEDRQQQERMARYTCDLIAYARGEVKVLQIPEAIEQWSDERIEAEARRVRENPTILDKLRAFARFVEAERYYLAEFGVRPGFVLQQAFNSTPAGPVADAAARTRTKALCLLLLRTWPENAGLVLSAAPVRTLEGHNGQVMGLGVTPNGRRAVSVGKDGTLRVWNLETGACVHTLEGHTGGVDCVCITPDGRRATSGSDDRTLRIWDLEAGACLGTLEGSLGAVVRVSMTACGRRAVSVDDRTVRVWNLETGTLLHTLEGHTDSVHGVIVTPDRCRVVSGSFDRTLRVWDLETGVCLRILEGQNCLVSVTPDGQRVVSQGLDDTVQVWDLETGRYPRILDCHMTNLIDIVSEALDLKRTVSAGTGESTRAWDSEAGACLRLLEGGVDTVSVTPDGRRAVSVIDGCRLGVWDLERGVWPRAEGNNVSVYDLGLTPDGERAFSGSWDGTLRMWNVETGTCLQTMKGHTDSVNSVSVTADGQRAVSGGDDKSVRLWDLERGACLVTLEGHTDSVNSVSVTPDGRRAVSGSRDDTLRVWDLETGACLRTLEASGIQLVEIAQIWYAEPGAHPPTTHSLRPRGRWIFHVAVSPDGRRAVSASRDLTLQLWDLETGACLRRLQGHRGWVCGLGVTPNGLRAVSGSWDRTIRLWNLETGACEQVLGLFDPIHSLVLSGNLIRVLSGSSTGEVTVYDVRIVARGQAPWAPESAAPSFD